MELEQFSNFIDPIKYLNKFFKYERPGVYKLLTMFGIAIVIGSFTMANNVYLILCKDLFKQSIDLKTRLQDNKLPLIMIMVGILSGPIILGMFWCISIRFVKYLILHKGSEKATVVTYHPLKGEKTVTVPIDEISCIVSRIEKRSCVNMKIKNHKFQYILDKSGNFVNPELFDTIICRYRF